MSELLPLYYVSGFFAGVTVLGFLVPFIFSFEQKGLIRWSITMAAFSCWLLYVVVYISQLHPLIGPRLDNTTLAWLGHKYGQNPRMNPIEIDLDMTEPAEPKEVDLDVTEQAAEVSSSEATPEIGE